MTPPKPGPHFLEDGFMTKGWSLVSRLLLASACLAAWALPVRAQSSTDPGDSGDPAAFWSPSAGVLHTLPEDELSALGAIGAQPSSEKGLWTANALNADGSTVPVTFRVDYVSPANLVFLVNAAGDEIPCPHPNYVVYKNSVCGPTFPLGYPCQPNGTGSSQRWDYLYRTCRRSAGAGYCVNVKSIVGRIDYFDLANCQSVPIFSNPLFGWACRQ
jgi:hypothetical protein